MRLAVCAEMMFLDLPITERVQRIAEAGFDAEIWDWTRHDVEDLAATGAVFSSMTGYIRGDFGAGADELIRTAQESIAVAQTLDCPRLNLHGTGLDGKGLPVVPGEDMPGPLWISAARTLTRLGDMAERAGVTVDPAGFIPVSKQLRTSVPHIFAIGDVVGQPMLAHKAMHEAKVAAEVIAGKNSFFDARAIPSVAYTDPEVAWTGVTENEARAAGVAYGKGVFPWAASGRSLTLGRSEGMTKVLFDEATGRIIGCGITGPSAGDLISEAVLAIEMGADAADIGLTIHPHPTLSETVAMAAEAFEGTITDLYLPRRPGTARSAP